MIDRRMDLIFPSPVAVVDTGAQDLCKRYADMIQSNFSEAQEAYLKKFSFISSADNLHKQPEYFDLVNLINNEVKLFVEEGIGISFDDLKLQNMWCNTHLSGSKHHIHWHPNAYLSGVIYLNIPTDPGTIPGDFFFVDPRPAAAMQIPDYKTETQISKQNWWYTPKTGLLIMFPSWLSHGTEPPVLLNGSKRICVSWNYILTKSSQHTMTIGD